MSKTKVMIVDDDSRIRDLLRIYLIKADFQVIEAEDLLQRGTSTGRYFKKGLSELAREFPQVVAQVRGRGMMLGIRKVS